MAVTSPPTNETVRDVSEQAHPSDGDAAADAKPSAERGAPRTNSLFRQPVRSEGLHAGHTSLQR